MSSPVTLLQRHTDATYRLILSSAVDLLERQGFGELTVRAVAKHAGMSERTVFRYFPSRDEFLDGVAAEVVRTIAAPDAPDSLDSIVQYVEALYSQFETNADLVSAALHTDVYSRIRQTAARSRWDVVSQLFAKEFGSAPAKERIIAAANVSYYLTATTWNYYRFNFGLSAEETVECAQSAIRAALQRVTSG